MISDTIKKVISEAYVLYFKAHSYHWNIEGPDFDQYHKFLGAFYEEVFESIDEYAELIRTQDQYAPTSLGRLIDMSAIQEAESIPNATGMLQNIKNDNDKFLATLVVAYDEAEKASEFGVSNYIQDRIQAHEKHAWMLRAITK